MLLPTLTLTPRTGGSSLVIPGADSITRDPLGNVTFDYSEAVRAVGTSQRLTVDILQAYLSTRIDQKLNRAGAYLVITDEGGKLLDVTWKEVDPWSGTLLEYDMVAVVSLASYRSSLQDGFSLIAYRAHYRFERVTEVLESA